MVRPCTINIDYKICLLLYQLEYDLHSLIAHLSLSSKVSFIYFELFWFRNNLILYIYTGFQVILMILAANAAVGVITETNAEKALEVGQS